jgi:GNAT superfamily N-acetyltransferase
VKIENESISLRPVTADDEAFLLELYTSSRGDDLRGLGWEEDRISEFLAMQYEAQQKFQENDYPKATDEIILCDRERAGRLLVDRREHEIRCVDIALLPAFRNHGVGSFLIRQLQDDARAEQKPLRVQVIRFNRANSLFERLGFERTSETGTHFQMEWTPRVRSPSVSEGS